MALAREVGVGPGGPFPPGKYVKKSLISRHTLDLTRTFNQTLYQFVHPQPEPD